MTLFFHVLINIFTIFGFCRNRTSD
ncbi:hypothetical protein CY0110_19022 [Crocosphaera chwakensis CCY0110]|uniref:Uncharacterized protein n=1 Tax=Crocosphaera chwakensis CCY0110 TaxID=391612 RepID=A3IJD6_9CHRO|nr:hypothetical protein CY0110_19022 [Crocosphaera chwakensis CCY0110]